MSDLEIAATKYARVNIDENKIEGFVSGARWMCDRLVRIMQEHPMMSTQSKGLREMSAGISVQMFWECIDEVFKQELAKSDPPALKQTPAEEGEDE